jgi:hypothetical protein
MCYSVSKLPDLASLLVDATPSDSSDGTGTRDRLVHDRVAPMPEPISELLWDLERRALTHRRIEPSRKTRPPASEPMRGLPRARPTGPVNQRTPAELSL